MPDPTLWITNRCQGKTNRSDFYRLLQLCVQSGNPEMIRLAQMYLPPQTTIISRPPSPPSSDEEDDMPELLDVIPP